MYWVWLLAWSMSVCVLFGELNKPKPWSTHWVWSLACVISVSGQWATLSMWLHSLIVMISNVDSLVYDGHSSWLQTLHRLLPTKSLGVVFCSFCVILVGLKTASFPLHSAAITMVCDQYSRDVRCVWCSCPGYLATKFGCLDTQYLTLPTHVCCFNRCWCRRPHQEQQAMDCCPLRSQCWRHGGGAAPGGMRQRVAGAGQCRGC